MTPPRVFVMANNRLGASVVAWLRAQDVELGGLAIHPQERRRYGDEILEAAGLPARRIFDGSRLEDPTVLELIGALGCDLGVSVLFGYIVRPPFLALFPRGVVNLHPALLPYNRGAQPNVWAIVDGTPAGATLHYIDPGVDTGDVIAQAQTEVSSVDTGETLYHKLERDSLTLFQKAWPALADGTAPRSPQSGEGTHHRTRDRATIDEIDLDRSYRAGDLINILRATTFPPYHGAFFRVGGQRIYLRLQLEAEKEPA